MSTILFHSDRCHFLLCINSFCYMNHGTGLNSNLRNQQIDCIQTKFNFPKNISIRKYFEKVLHFNFSEKLIDSIIIYNYFINCNQLFNYNTLITSLNSQSSMGNKLINCPPFPSTNINQL